MPPKQPPKEKGTKNAQDAYEQRVKNDGVCTVNISFKIWCVPKLIRECHYDYDSGEDYYTYTYNDGVKDSQYSNADKRFIESNFNELVEVYADYVDLYINNNLVKEFDLTGKKSSTVDYQYSVDFPVKFKKSLLLGSKYIMEGKTGAVVKIIYYHQGHRFEQPMKMFVFDNVVNMRGPNKECFDLWMDFSIVTDIMNLMKEL